MKKITDKDLRKLIEVLKKNAVKSRFGFIGISNKGWSQLTWWGGLKAKIKSLTIKSI